MSRWLFTLSSSLLMAAGETWRIPTEARQGDTIRVGTTDTRYSGGRVLWNTQSVPLYPQPDKSLQALIGVPATLKPGEYPIEIENADRTLEHLANVQIHDSHFPIHNITVSKRTKALRPLPGEMKAVANLKNLETPHQLWTEPFRSPVPDCINSVFGVARHHNNEPTGNYHKGVDFRSPHGRPVRAITSGRIALSRMFRLHGGTVGIDHGQGLTSIHIHLSRLGPRAGTLVKAGDIIGYVGATGFATGPHLHWQLFVHGTPVNPTQWIPGVPLCE